MEGRALAIRIFSKNCSARDEVPIRAGRDGDDGLKLEYGKSGGTLPLVFTGRTGIKYKTKWQRPIAIRR